MNIAIQALITAALSVYNERIKTKSTIDGAVLTGVAAAAGMGELPMIEPGSLESYFVMLIMGAIGIYRVLKKDKV